MVRGPGLQLVDRGVPRLQERRSVSGRSRLEDVRRKVGREHHQRGGSDDRE